MPLVVAVGQIWQEVDPRKTRYVRVERVGLGGASIRTVEKIGEEWRPARGSHLNWAARERFNGKRGGYMLTPARSPVLGASR